MAEIVRMPKMSDTMTEGIVVKWHKKIGDVVRSGDLVAEIETDKATMDYESYHEGTLLHIAVKEGASLNVDDILAIIGKKGEDISALLKSNITHPKKNTLQKSQNAQKEHSTADISAIKASIVAMPKMSDTMTEGIIVAWHKEVGDSVKTGELIAEIETDKATMEYESYHNGTVLYKGGKENETIAVDDVLAIVGEKNADWRTLLQTHKLASVDEKSTPVNTSDDKKEVSSSEQIVPIAHEANTQTAMEGRIKVSPLARTMAREKGYDLAEINGSGDNGRIVKRDVENYMPPSSQESQKGMLPHMPSLPYGEENYEDVALSTMRKTIARRLSESKFSAPHFYLTMEINMDRAITARKNINAIASTKISFNDIIIKAVAAALRQHPDVNVSWRGDKIRKNKHIHIGVAVAVEEGLVVPVLRFADHRSLSHLTTAVKEFVKKAQQKKLQPTDYEGSTFTISNLGMFGISEFTAVINPPNACILAVGAIKEVPIVKNHELVPGNTMNVTLSCDHRAVDGAVGSAFLLTLKQMLEDPVCILI